MRSMMMSDSPPRRRSPLGTSAGVNVPARSRGTSRPTGSTSVNSVFGVEPLRELPERPPAPVSGKHLMKNQLVAAPRHPSHAIRGQLPPRVRDLRLNADAIATIVQDYVRADLIWNPPCAAG